MPVLLKCLEIGRNFLWLHVSLTSHRLLTFDHTAQVPGRGGGGARRAGGGRRGGRVRGQGPGPREDEPQVHLISKSSLDV